MLSQNLDGKIVFVTGGTGTIGSQVVRELLIKGAHIIVYSRDQNKQFKMDHDIASKRVTYKNGDICDYDLLLRSMANSDYVVHCAASKHVPLCENNVESSVKININGTLNVLRAAYENNIDKFLLLSTDKAVNPTSVMGMTKCLAERMTLEFSNSLCTAVVRLGNVFASNGSVVPTFQDRIKNKLPLIVTNRNADRYFITKKEVAKFIVERLEDMQTGKIYIKEMKRMEIAKLAECMGGIGYPILFTELTKGEKMIESLYSFDEIMCIQRKEGYLQVNKEAQPISFIPCTGGPEPQYFTDSEIMEMLKEIK